MSLPLMSIAPGVIESVLFYLFALMTVGAALAVVISQNIVRTAVALLVALLGVAGLYLSLHAEFMAALQLVVYAGGTLVLIVFGVMLTNNSTHRLYKASRVEIVIAVGLAALLSVALISAILSAGFETQTAVEPQAYPVLDLGQALLGDYLVPFEIISVLLLAVMIGAAYLAKARRREERK
jgi:NADH-quinone oxidoreductase subunit J